MDDGKSEPGAKLTREERLARQLRENLKRRKEQGRAQARTQADYGASETADSGLPKSGVTG